MPKTKPVPKHDWLSWLHEAPRRAKQAVLLLIDIVMLPVLFTLALSVRMGELDLPSKAQMLDIPLMISFMVICALFTRVYSAVVRAFDEHYLQSALFASVAWVMLLWIAASADITHTLPRSVIIITGALLMLHFWVSRALIRAVLYFLLKRREQHTNLAVFGAGQAGRQIMAAAAGMAQYRLTGFFDDDPELIGTRINGLPVWSGRQAQRYIGRLDIDEVIVAMPSVSRSRRRDIVDSLQKASGERDIHIRMLPGLDRVMSGDISFNDVQDIDILDLLGRDAMPPDLALFRHHVADRVVLVTGAAGSIGSELCRQLLTATPSTLVLFDHSEFGLYNIERELRASFPDATLVPVLGSVMDQARLERLMRHHNVETVYHAAAYKHVPLVEANPFEGVINNSLGTYHTAVAARDAGVETFVLVSTDKAVRPTNVMGASKRLSELVLQALAAEPIEPGTLGTCYAMVRFGNVLGSSGSVVPLFRKQISQGGPITLTHPDITRYFMTIPEAAQLVIQAGGMAKGGEVFLLEMGESVRILDLARQMIRLSGLSERTASFPDGDIEVVFTGLRPGEKLYEELLISDEGVENTDHPLIYKAHERFYSLARIEALFAEISELALKRDTIGLKQLLLLNVHGYKPDFAAEDYSGCLDERPEDAMSIAAFEAELDRPYDETQVTPV